MYINMAPYRKSARKYTKKRSWYDKKYSAQQLAVKAWKATKYLKGLVNSEMLHVDTSFSGTTIPNTGTVTHLTAISQGDTAAGRTGNSLLLRSLTYRARFEINSAVTSNTAITMIVFMDKQQVSDTAPAPGDILTGLSTESLLSLNTGGRFRIMMRKSYVLTPASGGRPAIEIAKYFNIQKHVRYNGTASTDIQKNGLYVLLISSEATNVPSITGNFRIGYHDN